MTDDRESIMNTGSEPGNEAECYRKYQSFAGEACPATWDSFFCWPPTPPGQSVTVSCQRIFPFLAPHPEATTQAYADSVAYRLCGDDGVWSAGQWTNYTECERLLDIRVNEDPPISPVTVSYVTLVGSVLSLVCLLVSLFIFAYFKALQCSRVRVHRNLVLSLILHALMMVAVALPGISREAGRFYKHTEWLCKGVIVLKMYSSMACIQWMFVEGLLLHSSVAVSVFRREAPFRVYYSIGWGLPLVCVTIWVVLMSSYHPERRCWKGYGLSLFVWIITGPMIVALLVNAVFLVNIIRILVTKLRNSLSVETKQVKKAMKATALLIPLLGITHLLFCINPRDDAHLEHLYMLVNALMQASQGLFVAVLYCFLNSEVQSVLSSAYSRRLLLRGGPRRPSCRSSSTRVMSTASGPASRTALLLLRSKEESKVEQEGETAFL